MYCTSTSTTQEPDGSLLVNQATKSSARFITLHMLSRTSAGLTSPTTVTFLLSSSTLKDTTPAQQRTQIACIVACFACNHSCSAGMKISCQACPCSSPTLHLGDLLFDLPRAAMAVHGHLQSDGLGGSTSRVNHLGEEPNEMHNNRKLTNASSDRSPSAPHAQLEPWMCHRNP